MSLKNNNLILLLLLIAGCKQMPQVSLPMLPGLGPHKIDIQQGNVITQEMLDKLQPGMTRNQVRFVLGTPLLVDPFRTDRWDYVYSMKKRGELLEQRQLKVFFQDDKMVRYEGDVVTSAKPGAEAVAAVKPTAKPAAKPVEKPAAAPVAKTEVVPPKPASQPEMAQPAVPTPVAVTPTREAAADVGRPQLQMAPGPGEPAKPEELKPPVPAAPREPDSLDMPPLPRLILPPEPSEPSSPVATTPDTPAKPVPAKPAVKLAEKPPAGPGFFGRLFGRSPSQPSQPSAAAPVAKPDLPVKPAAAPVPAPVIAPAPAEKPVVAKPVPKPAETLVVTKPESKPAEKPATERGFFGRLLDAAAKQPSRAVTLGGERIAEPGSPPPPFVDPEPAQKKP